MTHNKPLAAMFLMRHRPLRVCRPDSERLRLLSRVQGSNRILIPLLPHALSLREKQIQQNYRPIIGIHKWFARRPGTVFRSLLLAEYNSSEPLETGYWHEHKLKGVIADPFMGGGTPIYEANRLGFSILGADTNPMAFWVVRQALGHLAIHSFVSAAEEVASAVEDIVGELYETRCGTCGQTAQAKYFIWVKTERCPSCQAVNDLFPGYLLAKDSRHPKHVVVCNQCGCLNEYDEKPSKDTPLPCAECSGACVHGRAGTPETGPMQAMWNRVRVPLKRFWPSARPPDVGYGVPLQGVQTDPHGTVLQTP